MRIAPQSKLGKFQAKSIRQQWPANSCNWKAKTESLRMACSRYNAATSKCMQRISTNSNSECQGSSIAQASLPRMDPPSTDEMSGVLQSRLEGVWCFTCCNGGPSSYIHELRHYLLISHGFHLDSMWIPCGFHVDSILCDSDFWEGEWRSCQQEYSWSCSSHDSRLTTRDAWLGIWHTSTISSTCTTPTADMTNEDGLPDMERRHDSEIWAMSFLFQQPSPAQTVRRVFLETGVLSTDWLTDWLSTHYKYSYKYSSTIVLYYKYHRLNTFGSAVASRESRVTLA